MPDTKTPRPTRMVEFTIDEISFVTRGAQTPALGAIIKGDFSNISDEDLLNDGYWNSLEAEFEKNGDLAQLSSTVENDHEHAIRMTRDEKTGKIYVWVQHASSTEDSHGHEHQIVAAPDGTYRLTENVGHTHEIDQSKFSTLLAQMAVQGMEKASSDVPKEAGITSQTVGKKETSMTDENKADIEKANKENESLKAQVKELEKVSKMTDAEKNFMEGLDKEKKAEFMAMTPADRKRMMGKTKKAADEAKEVVYKSLDGQEFTKADDARLVEMAKQSDETRKELALEKAARENDRLTKAANEELQFLPGSVEVRAALYKAAEGIASDDIRKGALDALKAHNSKLAPNFETVGKSYGQPDPSSISKKQDANDELDKMAKSLSESAKISYFDAYSRVSEDNPNLANAAIAG